MTTRGDRRIGFGLLSLSLVFWSLFPSWVSGQEQKPSPPPSRSLAIPDTARAGEKPEAQPAGGERPKLELPDVLIIGQDRSRRQEGEKLYGEAVPVSLQEPLVDYPPVQLRPESPEAKHVTGRELAVRAKGLEAIATYGDYRWLKGEAIHWAQHPKLNYQVSGRVDRTDGQYPFSGWEKWRLGGRIGFGLREQGRVRLHLAAMGQETEMNTPIVSREGSGIDLGGEFTGSLGRLRIRLASDVGIASFDQDLLSVDSTVAAGPDLVWNAEARRSKLEASCEWEATPVAILAGLRYTGGRFTPDLPDSLLPRARDDLSSLFLELNIPVAQRASVGGGVSLETLKQRGENRRSRLFVNARAAGTVAPRIGLSAEFRSGFQTVDPLEIWTSDPYFDPRNMDWRAERLRSSLGFGAELKLVSGSRIRFRWKRAHLNGAHYWEEVADTSAGGTGTYLFRYRTLDRLERNELALGFDVHSGSALSASVELVQLSEELEAPMASLSYPGFTRRPFQAHWRLPVQCSWRPIPALRLGLLAAWVGRRPRDLAGEHMLSAYTSADLNAEFAVTKNFLIRGELRNLTNQRIVPWTGHPQFNRTLALGIHGVW